MPQNNVRNAWTMIAVTVMALASPAAAQKRIDPAGWFDSLDLPRQLLPRIGTNGKVVVDVAVSPEGQPLGCTVAVASGTPELDELTCALIKRRAHYTARRDEAGAAIAGNDRVTVDWRLFAPPAEPAWSVNESIGAMLTRRLTFAGYGLPTAGNLRVEVAVSETGLATNCTIVQSSGAAAFDSWLCKKLRNARPFARLAANRGPAAAARTQLSVRWDTIALSYGNRLEILGPLTR